VKKDITIILVLVVFILLFWLPAFLKWVPLLGDDYIYHHFPIKMLYARSLQQGTLPWWDPHTFCGAWPITHRPDGGPYYLPDYPFLLLVNLSSFDLAADLLIKVPMLLHYIIMIVSAYLLGRFGLRLNRIGSVVLSVAYTMSPAVNYLAFAASIVTLNCWLPLLWLFLLLFIRKGGIRYAALGAFVLALQISGAGAGHMIRGWTFTAFIFAGLAIKHLFSRDWVKFQRVIFGWIMVVIIGLLLSAPVWLGLLEGVKSLDSAGVITFKNVSDRSNSLNPQYLSTLLIPNLFGSVVGAHGWGVGRQMLFDQANLLGGMLLIFLVVSGFIAVRYSTGTPERFWMILTGIGVVLAAFIVLGRHTPVYRFLFDYLPNFRVPYAIRWRDFQCYSMALLAGASASLITRNTLSLERKFRFKILLYILSVAIVIIFVISQPIRFRRILYSTGIEQGMATGEFWYSLNNIIPYLLLVLVIFIAMWIKPRRRAQFLIGGVLVELIIWGSLTFYFHRDWFGKDPLIEKYYNFDETPLARAVRLRNRMENEDSGLFRTAFYRSRLANSSWLTGGLSLFGYDCKPLLPRFNKVLHQLGPDGLIYEMVVEKWDTRFLANMSVDRAVIEAEQVKSGVKSPTTDDIVIPVVETDGPEALLAVAPVVIEVSGVIPRIFTHDQVVACSEEEALEELVYGDLRRGVFIEEGEQLAVSGERWAGLITEYGPYKPGDEQEFLKHFNELQAANKIIELDTANPNRVNLTIEMARSAMLVMTDVWHPDWSVEVDGHPAELLRVNYLQRGLWLDKGRHKVIMTFVPQSWRLGRWGTASGVLLILGMMIFGKWGNRGNNIINHEVHKEHEEKQ
jgi:hypothetical protein